MSHDQPTRPEASPSVPDGKAATSAAFSAFTRAHVKALLILAASPPGDASDADDKVALVERSLDDLTIGLGTTGAELIQRGTDGSAPVDRLRALKSLARTLFADAVDAPQREAVSVLYHLAIAAAYSWHGAHITSLPWSDRMPFYSSLAESFAGSRIGDVFTMAVRRGSEPGDGYCDQTRTRSPDDAR